VLRFPASVLVAVCALVAAHAVAAQTVSRPVLAVFKFQDETGAMMMQGGAGRALSNMLANELAARGTFTVVERRKLNAILEEQNLVQAGLLAPGDGAKIGRLTGAQHLVMGTVTAFEEAGRTRVSLGLFGGRGDGGSKRDYLAVDLRIVDTTTGEISFARTIEAEMKRTHLSLSAPIVSVDKSGGPTESRAVRAAVIEVIDYLECAMVRRDACLARYEDKDRLRIETTRKALTLEGDRRK
jgi:curli biogenesis system outer membrane secretion channel CsgG